MLVCGVAVVRFVFLFFFIVVVRSFNFCIYFVRLGFLSVLLMSFVLYVYVCFVKSHVVDVCRS